MDINFGQPFYLFLSLPAIFLLIWWWRTQKRVKGTKRTLIFIIRMLVFTSLILSLARLEMLFPIEGKTVIFVVDQSNSMNKDPKIENFLISSIQEKAPEDRYGIVSVGAEAEIEQPLTIRNELTALGAVLNPNATNLQDGLRLASGMIPSNTNGKIVLITDGLETQGDVVNEVKILKERGIQVDVYSLQHELGNEVLLSSLEIPNSLRLHEKYNSTVKINSNVQTEGTLRFYQDNQEVGFKKVSINKGENRFLFEEEALSEGFHKYRVELVVDKDQINVNNQAYAFTNVVGKPTVLVLEGHQGAAFNLINALRAGNVDVDIKDISLLPKELEDYKKYSSIVLADVQATQLTDNDMQRIKTSVKDLGIGLIMTGGNDSFGLGGWFRTPIEEALPVNMNVRSKEETPSLGLVLIIDKSGSMAAGATGYGKMELAKEAALRATEMLKPDDYVSVVAFDGNPWLVVEAQPAKNLEDIQEKISGIQANGGTSIFPALNLGYMQMKDMKTKRKHIILLTDGQSATDGNYFTLIDEMKKDKVTLSTVAIGDGADTFLLEELAKAGKGRFYFSNDPSTIPKIFSKETALASKSFIVEKPQIPIKSYIGDFSTLNGSLPYINAYNATTPKLTAELNLLSMEQDPIMASWQFGLGRSIAWTTDVEGKWSNQWVTWSKYSSFWNQVVTWTFPQVETGKWRTSTGVDGTMGTITVETKDAGMPQLMEAIIVNGEMESSSIKLKPIAPGRLQGHFDIDDEGTYMIQVIEKQGEAIVANQTNGLNISYSPEYSILSGGDEKINRIIESSGGKLIEKPEEAFDYLVANGSEQQDISLYLLMLATILWPIDIGLRRINTSFKLLERIRSRFMSKQDSEASEHLQTLSGLMKKKSSLETGKGRDSLKNTKEIFVKENPVMKEKQESNDRFKDMKSTGNYQKKNTNQTTNKSNDSDTFSRLLKAKNKRKE